jgi:hypothetical protein
MSGLIDQVSAIAPLREAIDGTPQAKPKRERRKPEPSPAVEHERRCARCGCRTADSADRRDVHADAA